MPIFDPLSIKKALLFRSAPTVSTPIILDDSGDLWAVPLPGEKRPLLQGVFDISFNGKYFAFALNNGCSGQFRDLLAASSWKEDVWESLTEGRENDGQSFVSQANYLTVFSGKSRAKTLVLDPSVFLAEQMVSIVDKAVDSEVRIYESDVTYSDHWGKLFSSRLISGSPWREGSFFQIPVDFPVTNFAMGSRHISMLDLSGKMWVWMWDYWTPSTTEEAESGQLFEISHDAPFERVFEGKYFSTAVDAEGKFWSPLVIPDISEVPKMVVELNRVLEGTSVVSVVESDSRGVRGIDKEGKPVFDSVLQTYRS